LHQIGVENMEQLLEIKNLTVQYKTERATVSALNGLSLSIGQGESVGLVGETGAGKTTTALSILRLSPKNSKILGGEIFFKGESILDMSENELMEKRGNKISMVFQNPLTALNPVFTVGEQISMVLRRHRGMNSGEAMKYAGKLLEQVGIASYRVKDYPNQFSGGMRQRVGIASAIACNPELLIADEPTTALDVTIQAQILELMKDLQTKYKTSLLMITHNLGIVNELCQKVAVIYAGRIIEYGTVKSVFKSPQHPYTIGLLGALPALSGSRDRLVAIPGKIADSQNLPSGCFFHPRCQYCMNICKENQPQMICLSDDHFVACYYREKV
jgi:peptide/nickel transport system ATP-binding protein